jgi:hypothetical protein
MKVTAIQVSFPPEYETRVMQIVRLLDYKAKITGPHFFDAHEEMTPWTRRSYEWQGSWEGDPKSLCKFITSVATKREEISVKICGERGFLAWPW